MKILYITTVGGTMPFFKELIKELIDMGHTVDLACNETEMPVADYFKEWGCQVFPLSCERSPFNYGNLRTISEIRKLVEGQRYDIVHCHTPIAAACTRIACKKVRKMGIKVYYTAHGFHFYKGASVINWLMFFPVEWICSWWTDVLITINKEDYVLAKSHFHANKIVHVPGVGINLKKFENVNIDIEEKRRELGIPLNVNLILSVGELNANKNHETIIRAIKDINDIYYVIAGEGELHSYLQRIIDELKLSHRVKLLGFRKDVEELCAIADIFAFPSKREGLGLAAIEAMASSLPIITSNIHGINDYSIDGITGYKCSPESIDAFKDAIKRIVSEENYKMKYGLKNSVIAQEYSVEKILEIMKNLYGSEM